MGKFIVLDFGDCKFAYFGLAASGSVEFGGVNRRGQRQENSHTDHITPREMLK